MHLNNPNADIYVPDGADIETALARTTHLAISAHQDDIEIMAYHGIAECFTHKNKWFTGVVVTNGSGSPRAGLYANYTDEEMQKVRIHEQRKAAFIGEYSCQIQLGYTSADAKNPQCRPLIDDLETIIKRFNADIIYLHNLADKHDTHIGTTLRALTALRRLTPKERPKAVYGCEVWRDLDWMPDESKTVLSVSGRPNISSALVSVFDSQVTGGKRYDLATAGRRMANATYFTSHEADKDTAITFAMDLTPLVQDQTLDPAEYTANFIEQFKQDVTSRINKFI